MFSDGMVHRLDFAGVIIEFCCQQGHLRLDNAASLSTFEPVELRHRRSLTSLDYLHLDNVESSDL